MYFYGLKKVTLIDYPGKIACAVFTHGCSLRCPYCHNPELVTGNPNKLEPLTQKELTAFLTKRISKLDGIVFTGGEPLMHHMELLPLLKTIKRLGLLIKFDTNGTYPSALRSLIQKKVVDYIAMDVKTSLSRYQEMGASPTAIQSIQQSLSLLTASHVPYELRTTLVPGMHTPAVLHEMGSIIKSAERYALQNFIPSTTLDTSFSNIQPFTHKEMKVFHAIARSYNPETILHDQQL